MGTQIGFSSLIALILLGSHTLSAQSPATQHLLQLLNTPDFIKSDEAADKLTRATIDAGSSAVSSLRGLIRSSTGGEQRFLALGALAFIGGDTAVSIIRQEFEAGNTEVKPLLAFVLGSVDSSQNRALLVRLLGGDQSDDDGTIQTAALSLGVLRANEAVESLRAVARESSNTGASETAELALTWIQKGYWAVDMRSIDEGQRVVAAVLRNGIPNTREDDYYFDEENRGFWKYGTSGWTFSKGKPQDVTSDGPTLNSFVGTDGSRALVSVSIYCGLRCGYGYDFLLRKEGNDWKVQGMILTWIA